MLLVEPDVFFETGVAATLEKADGSASLATVGHLEDAAFDYATGETTRSTDQKTFTCPAADAAGFAEGDSLVIGSTTREILDLVGGDETVATFLLAAPAA